MMRITISEMVEILYFIYQDVSSLSLCCIKKCYAKTHILLQECFIITGKFDEIIVADKQNFFSTLLLHFLHSADK